MTTDFEDRDPFAGQPKTLIVGVRLGATPEHVVDDHLDELDALAGAAGAEVLGREVQRRQALDPALFIGRGKAEEIGELVRESELDLVLFDDDLTAGQVKNLEKIVECAVMDRSALILEIFHQRARSGEARAQVELARLRYLLPRLTRRWSHLSRQAGGIGVRGGEGESQLEADRRMLRRRIQRLEKDLVRIERTRNLQRRGRQQVREIALAGYTNAGKSTLFNQLTGADTLVKNQVFATLDSKLRKGHLGGGRTAVFADTVGFVRKLPHHLVASFRSTLGEVLEADVVLHVVDRSHPAWMEQQSVGDEVLRDLGVEVEKIILVHNKIDRVETNPREDQNQDHDADQDQDHGTDRPNGSSHEALRISAITGHGIEELKKELGIRLFGKDGRIAPWMRAPELDEDSEPAVPAETAEPQLGQGQ